MANTEELGLEVFVEGWRRFEQIMDRLDDSIDDTAKSMEKTGSIAGGAFAVALGTIAVNAAMALGRALLDAGRAVFEFGAESLQMAADFQGQMAILEIAASSTGLSFDQLHDAALQVGGDTRLMGVSATGAADAMTGLFKAGLSNVEVFGDLQGFMDGTAELGGALRASIDLAAASELDMVQASDLAAVALASFGAELETETERAEFINAAMDNMVQAADASVAEVSDLAQALTMVGPSAGAAGISIQDTNNALALLSTRGIAGSRAGTSLDAMFRSLTDTTPKAQEAMDALGISVFDLDGGMLPLVDIIGQFETALGDATDAERAAALGAVFTAQGQRAMNTLLSEGVEGWDDMATATANAAGIQEQAAARSQTFNAQMEALEGTVETLKIGIGEQFLPVAQDLAVWAGEMVSQHGPRLQEIFSAIAGVISTAAEIVMGFIDGSLGIADFIPVGSEVQGVFDTMGAWWAEFGPAIQEAAANLFTTFAEKATELKDNVLPFLNELLLKFSDWWNENGPLIVSYIEQVSEVWSFLITAVVDFWAVVEPILTGLFDIILELVTFVLAIATGDWATAWEAIKEVVNTAWEAIKESWDAFVEFVLGFLGTTWAEVAASWEASWELFKEIVRLAWEAIQLKATEIWEAIVAFIDEKLQALLEFLGINTDEMKERWSAILADIQEIAEEVWSRIVEFVTEQVENIKVAVEEKITELKEFWGPIWDEISTTVSTTWDAIVLAVTEKVQDVMDSITTKVDEIKSWLEGKVSDFTTIGGNLIEGLKAGIVAKAQEVISAVTGLVEDAIAAAQSALGIESHSKVGIDIGKNFDLGIAEGLASFAPMVSAQMQAVVQAPAMAMAGGGGAGATSNLTQNFNLTTQSIMRPGGLALEFQTISLAGR